MRKKMCDLQNCRQCEYDVFESKKNKRFFDSGFWGSVVLGAVLTLTLIYLK